MSEKHRPEENHSLPSASKFCCRVSTMHGTDIFRQTTVSCPPASVMQEVCKYLYTHSSIREYRLIKSAPCIVRLAYTCEHGRTCMRAQLAACVLGTEGSSCNGNRSEVYIHMRMPPLNPTPPLECTFCQLNACILLVCRCMQQAGSSRPFYFHHMPIQNYYQNKPVHEQYSTSI